MKVARAHKWWHGAANCSSPATFAAAANGFISVNTIRASHQVGIVLNMGLLIAKLHPCGTGSLSPKQTPDDGGWYVLCQPCVSPHCRRCSMLLHSRLIKGVYAGSALHTGQPDAAHAAYGVLVPLVRPQVQRRLSGAPTEDICARAYRRDHLAISSVARHVSFSHDRG